MPDELVDGRVVGHLLQLARLRCEVSPPHVIPGALEQCRLEGRRLLRVTQGAQTRTSANASSRSRPRTRPVPAAAAYGRREPGLQRRLYRESAPGQGP